MISITHPSSQNIDEVFDFMNRCDVSEFGKPDTSREDLEEQWSEIDLGKDAFVARDLSGAIIGYADVSRIPRGFTEDLYIHAELSPTGLEDQLMRSLENRVTERLSSEKNREKTLVNGYVTSVNERVQQVYIRFGFEVHTYHFQMRIDLEKPISPPEWPAQYQVRSFQKGDESELYPLIESVFTWAGRETLPYDSWLNLLFRGGRFDPELFVIVRDAGKMVGAILSYDEGNKGWIRQLAVHKDYQGQGLGKLLLLHIFSIFSRRQIPSVGLGVASSNEKAYQFYERNGMYRAREFIEYRKIIP